MDSAMLQRIIVGILIGLVIGFFLSGKLRVENKTKNLILAFSALVVISFVGASFMFGALYGVMAVGEIALGYWLSVKIFAQEKV